MSSLTDSIFGSSGDAPTADAASVFDTKVDIPEPREYPALKKRKTAAEEAAEKKKQRKPKKTDEEKAAEDAMIGPIENPDVVEEKDDVDERTVFVGNLPLHYTRRALSKLFVDCGKVESTRIRSVAAAGVKLPASQAGNQNLVKKVCSNTGQLDSSVKLSVLGYVVFSDKASIDAAVAKNNLAVPESDEVKKTISNNTAVRHIRVDRITDPVKDPSRTVFVGSLPYATDEESLAKHFSDKLNGKGSKVEELVEGVRIVRDPNTQLCKGFAYVLFRESASVPLALQKVHETTYLQRRLRVQVCGKRYKGRQGASTAPKAATRRITELTDSVGALKRVLTRQLTEKPRKRAVRSNSNKSGGGGVAAAAKKAGVSKRAVQEAKTGKRVKKIEKRLSKGMGKTRKA